MRIAVLSDIHSNLIALDAVLAHAGSVDAVWHLGDVVGYGPDPDAVVDRLAALGALGVRGNHDAAAVGGSEIEQFNPDARAAMEWTRRQIGPATVAWLDALAPLAIIDELTLVHGSPRDPIWEYVTSVSIARAGIAAMTTPSGLHGHTHVPVAFLLHDDRVRMVAPGPGTTLEIGHDRALINPGSVGQPRDGDPRASYLILEPDAGRVTWQRVAYDVAAVAATMRAAGLPERLARRLDIGA